jgi:hypothetical protein
VEKGEAQFVKIEKPKTKKVLERMKKTNKGVFLFEKDVKVKKRGKGKDFRLELERVGKLPPGWIRPRNEFFTRREAFFPFPRGVIILDYIEKLRKKYKPNSIAIGVMSARGSERYTTAAQMTSVQDAILYYDKRGVKHPFSGVYFFWY